MGVPYGILYLVCLKYFRMEKEREGEGKEGGRKVGLGRSALTSLLKWLCNLGLSFLICKIGKGSSLYPTDIL